MTLKCKIITKIEEENRIGLWPEYFFGEQVSNVIGIYELNDSLPIEFKDYLAEFRKDLNEKQYNLSNILIIGTKKESEMEELIKLEEQKVAYFQKNDSNEEQFLKFLKEQLKQTLMETVSNYGKLLNNIQNEKVSQNFVVFNQKEDKISDSSKLKRRKQGRLLKIMGDIANQLLSYSDAMLFYQKAQEYLNKTDDHLWVGGCLEGICSAYYTQFIYKMTLYDKIQQNQQDQQQNQSTNPYYLNFEKNITPKMKEAQQNFKQLKFKQFLIENYFKLLDALAESQQKQSFNTVVTEFINQVLPQNMQTNEIHARYFIRIGSLYKKLNMNRKWGYFIYQAAMQLSRSNTSLCFQLLISISSVYKLYPLEQNFNQKMSISFWPELQIDFLKHLLNSCTGKQSIRMKNKIIKNTLQAFYKDLSLNNQSALNNLLANVSREFMFLDHTNMSYMPLLQKIVIKPSSFIIKENPLLEGQQKEKNLFIYEPWKKSIQKLKFASNEEIYIEIHLINIFESPLNIDAINLNCEGVKVLNFPISIQLPSFNCKERINCKEIDDPYKTTIKYKLKALEEGTLKISGLVTRIQNTLYEHKIDERGFGIQYLKEIEKKENQKFQFLKVDQELQKNSQQSNSVSPKKQSTQSYDLHDITILEKLPDLQLSFINEYALQQNQQSLFSALYRQTEYLDQNYDIQNENQESKELNQNQQLDLLEQLKQNKQEDYLIFESNQQVQFCVKAINTQQIPIKKFKVSICLDFIKPPIQEIEFEWQDINLNAFESCDIIFVQTEEQKESIIQLFQKSNNEKSQNKENDSINKIVVFTIPNLKHSVKEISKFTINLKYLSAVENKYCKEITIYKNIQQVQSLVVSEIKIVTQNEFWLQENQDKKQKKEFDIQRRISQYSRSVVPQTEDQPEEFETVPFIQNINDNVYLMVTVNKAITSNIYKLRFKFLDIIIKECDLNLDTHITQIIKVDKNQLKNAGFSLESILKNINEEQISFDQLQKFQILDSFLSIDWYCKNRFKQGTLELPKQQLVDLIKLQQTPIQLFTQCFLIDESISKEELLPEDKNINLMKNQSLKIVIWSVLIKEYQIQFQQQNQDNTSVNKNKVYCDVFLNPVNQEINNDQNQFKQQNFILNGKNNFVVNSQNQMDNQELQDKLFKEAVENNILQKSGIKKEDIEIISKEQLEVYFEEEFQHKLNLEISYRDQINRIYYWKDQKYIQKFQ